MKRVTVTLGHRQARLLWQAASRGCDEFDMDEKTERLGGQMSEAMRPLTRAIMDAGYDPTEEIA